MQFLAVILAVAIQIDGADKGESLRLAWEPHRRVDRVSLGDRFVDVLVRDPAFRRVGVDDPGDLDGTLDVLRATANAAMRFLVDTERRPLGETIRFTEVDIDQL